MLLWWEVDSWVDDQLCELFSRAARAGFQTLG